MLSCTINRRKLRAALPGRPHRAEGDGPQRKIEIGRCGDDAGVVYRPSSRMERPNRAATPLAHDTAHGGGTRWRSTTGIRASSTKAAPTSRPPSSRTERSPGASPNFALARSNSAWAAMAVSGVLFRRFPGHRVAANQGERGIPAPDGDGEIERRNHPTPTPPAGCHCSISLWSGRSLPMVRP